MKAIIKKIFSYFGLGLKGLSKYAFDQSKDIRSDILSKYGYSGELLDIYVNNKGGVVHKWHHYLPIYDRYFSKFRNTPVRFLEIGVSKGGSIQMWRKYFGEKAIIYGIDINPECEIYNGQAGQIRIGSQVDSDFLRDVVSEMGGIDVVLDDGSHLMTHIRTTLIELFPHLENNGIYMIEDLHCAYWRNFEGGFGMKKNFFRFLDQIINDMHHWYHASGQKFPEISNKCTAIHIHDSITVLEKGAVFRPTHSKVG